MAKKLMYRVNRTIHDYLMNVDVVTKITSHITYDVWILHLSGH